MLGQRLAAKVFNILVCGPSDNFGFTKTECSLHKDQCFAQSRSLKSTDLRSTAMLECFLIILIY